MQNKSSRPVSALLVVVLALGGFFIPWWPLGVIAIILAALRGLGAFALIVGMIMDLSFGAPLGALHYLYFPFTLLAGLAVAAHLIGIQFIFNRKEQEWL